MAGIKFACPHCDRVCKVPPELAGKQGRCPGCRKGVEVPHASTVRESERHEPARPSARAPAQPPARVTEASCPACGAAAPLGTQDCPGCGAPLPSPRAPRAVVVALALFLCAPLIGLPCALVGLREARRRGHHLTLARWAVGLNAVNLLLFLIYEGARRL